MSEKFVIGLVGRMRSGKSTAAAALVKKLGFVEKFFAEPLKNVVGVLFRMSKEQLYTQSGKASFDHRYGETPRVVMQWFGQAVRDRFPGVWEMRLREAVLEDQTGRPIVVSDIRYDSEAEAVKALGGYIIEIVRPEKLGFWEYLGETIRRLRAHKSERGVKKDLIDMVMINDGDVEDLENSIIYTAQKLMREKAHGVRETAD